MKHTLKFLLLTAMLLTLTIPSFCQTAQDYDKSGLDKLVVNKDYDGAIADYTKAIALQPDDEEAYSRRAQAKLGKGDWDGAIADETKAIELKPDDDYAYSVRADAEKGKGDLDSAIADYTKMIELHPKMQVYYYNRAILKKTKGDYDGAIADDTKAIELYPDEENYSARGDLKADKYDYDGAIADYNKAIERNPKYADAYNGRGVAKFFKGDYDGAIADYNKIIELDIDYEPNATVYENRALARKAKGDLDGAIADYSKVIELQPDNAQAYWSRGCLRYDSHDFTNSLADFRSITGDYAAFRVWLIRTRLGETTAATTDLQTYLTGRTIGKPDDWASKVGHFLTGQLSEPEFLAAAKDADPKIEAGHLCEAYFYAGSKHLFAGDKATATDYFQKSITTDKKIYEEYSSAAAELKFLKAGQKESVFE